MILLSAAAGVGSFAIWWIIHVILWRCYRPPNYLIWLLLILIVIPALALGWLWWRQPVLWPVGIDPVLASICHLLLALCYTGGYAGVTEYSPSAEILRAVKPHMPQGVRPERLVVRSFSEYELTGKRLDNLCDSGFLRRHNGNLQLTPRGRRFVSFARWYRLAMGATEKGSG